MGSLKSKNKGAVKCLICTKELAKVDEKKYTPFCSKRCKLIDIGKWLNQSYVVPGPEIEEDDEQ